MLLTSAAAASTLLVPLCPAPAAAWVLHSKRSDVPCSLTVRNQSLRLVEARWVNYDGDEEPYATIPPGFAWTVDTYETHPWRFRDARTGRLVREYVAQRGQQLLQLAELDLSRDLDPDREAGRAARGPDDVGGGGGVDGAADGRRLRRGRGRGRAAAGPDAEAPTQLASRRQGGGAGPPGEVDEDDASASASPSPLSPGPDRAAGGFDGLGHPADQYTRARLVSVAVLPQAEQAVVVLGLEGYPHPLSLLVGLPEARQVVNAAGGARGRRPSLLATWLATLQAAGASLERVVITRQVGGIFYSRIVLSTGQAHAPAQGGGGAGGSSGGGRGRLFAPWPPAAGEQQQQQQQQQAQQQQQLISVDSRPSNALALALEAGVDVYVSIPIAELVQQQYLETERDLPDLILPPPEDAAAPLPYSELWGTQSA